MPIGERFHTTPRYIKHPPVATWPWRDGRSLDAGTAHIVHSNLSHLSERNLRHLGTVIGPGAIDGTANTDVDNPYVRLRLTDAQRPTAGTGGADTDLLNIAWVTGYDCLSIGVVPAVGVTLQTDPLGYRPRTVRVRGTAQRVQVAGAIYFVAALTATAAPPSVQRPLVWVKSSVYTAIGTMALDITLTPPGPVLPTREMLSRPDAALGSSVTRVLDTYVWLGWCSTNTTTDMTLKDRVLTMSAWESV